MEDKDKLGFPLISIERNDASGIEDVFEEKKGERCQTDGGSIGTVTITEEPPGAPEFVLTGDFVIGEEGSLSVKGTVHRKDGKLEKGKVDVEKGTGKFKDLKGQLTVEQCNPKRWSID